MQVAVWSVNCVLKEKPSVSKKTIERCRSATGTLTKSLRGLVAFTAALVMVGAGDWVVDMGVVGRRWRLCEAQGPGTRNWELGGGATSPSSPAPDAAERELPLALHGAAHARVAQVEAAPEQRGDVDGEERVGEQRVVDPEVRRDRTAEVAGP